MKTSFLNTMLVALIISTLVIAQSCSQSHGNGERRDKIEIPDLLERHESLGSAQEKQLVKSAYQKLVNQIENDTSQNPKPILDLAALFINEARVTANHEHYNTAALHVLDKVIEYPSIKKDAIFQAKSLKASVLLSQHQFKQALELGQAAVKLNAYNAQIYGVLVDANLELGNYKQAVIMSDKMMSIRPDLRSYSRVSYLREIHGDFKGAIEAMELAVQAGYPGYEETEWCRTILGGLYLKYGEAKKAKEIFEHSLQVRADYPPALAGLAKARTILYPENGEKELGSLKKAIDISPNAGYFAQLGSWYKNNGFENAANENLDKAEDKLKHHTHGKSKEHGHSHDGSFDLAKFYLQYTDNTREALHQAQHELESRPANIEVNWVIAGSYLKMEENAKAQEFIQRALATGTKDPEILTTAGLIYMKNGAMEEAIAMLQESFRICKYQKYVFSKEARAILDKFMN